MKYLSISEVATFKRAVKQRFGQDVLFHDSCGGQSFSLDCAADEEMKAYIVNYFNSKGFYIVFSKDFKSFVSREDLHLNRETDGKAGE